MTECMSEHVVAAIRMPLNVTVLDSLSLEQLAEVRARRRIVESEFKGHAEERWNAGNDAEGDELFTIYVEAQMSQVPFAEYCARRGLAA